MYFRADGNRFVKILLDTPAAVIFSEEGAAKTKLTSQMLFQTAAECDNTRENFNALEGQKQTLARLEEYLANMLAWAHD